MWPYSSLSLSLRLFVTVESETKKKKRKKKKRSKKRHDSTTRTRSYWIEDNGVSRSARIFSPTLGEEKEEVKPPILPPTANYFAPRIEIVLRQWYNARRVAPSLMGMSGKTISCFERMRNDTQPNTSHQSEMYAFRLRMRVRACSKRMDAVTNSRENVCAGASAHRYAGSI